LPVWRHWQPHEMLLHDQSFHLRHDSQLRRFVQHDSQHDSLRPQSLRFSPLISFERLPQQHYASAEDERHPLPEFAPRFLVWRC
jgi:hypothetical protein